MFDFLRKDENSNKWRDLIKVASAENSKGIIAGIKEDANRPYNLSTDGALRRQYFKGEYLPHFEKYLADLYPQAQRGGKKKEIHEYAVNYFKTWAIANADIYRTGQPKRIGESDDATARLEALCKQAKLSTRLADLEEKSHAAQQMFCRVLRNPKTDRLEVKKIWPDCVYPIVDNAAPEELEFCLAIGLQISEDIFELWVVSEDEKGRYWTATQFDENGDRAPVEVLKQKYRGRLPICAMYISEPDGSPFLETDGDKVKLANDTMLSWTELFHLVRMQAHNPIWLATNGDSVSPNGGPGGITRLRQDDTMGAIQTDPKIDEQRMLLETWSGAAARSQGQSPRAFMNNPQPLNSGVALRVDNQIAEEKRPQRISLMESFERENLLPILDEVDRLLPARKEKHKIKDVHIDFEKVSIVFPRAPNIEDGSQMQLRLEHAQSLGWISPERAAVEARYYDDEEAAKKGMDGLEPVEASESGEFAEKGERGPMTSIKKDV